MQTKLFIQLFFLVFLNSCSISNVMNSYEDIKEFFISNEININKKAIRDSELITKVIKLNNQDEQIGILVTENEKLQIWATSQNKILYSKNGKLIKTKGFDFDFEIFNYASIFKDKHKSSAFIRFFEPDSSYLEINYSISLIKTGSMKEPLSDAVFTYALYEEDFFVPAIGWKGKNYYWVDNEGYTWISKQQISPFKDKIRIEILKKNGG